MQDFKRYALRFAMAGCRAYLRYSPWPFGKRNLWDRLCRPYVNWRPIEVVATARYGGRFRCTVNDVIQSCIYYFGIWEPNLTEFVKERLRIGDIFVDVGANIGYYSILASRLVGSTGGVVAVEASPRISQALKHNLGLNFIRNVRVLNVAASDHAGTVKVYSGTPENLGGTTTLSTRGLQFEAVVPTVPIETILTADEIRRTRLIKIDVEGAELPILNSILRIIHELPHEVEIVVEISPEAIGEKDGSMRDVFARFGANGFRPYVLKNDYSAAGYLERSRPVLPQPLEDELHNQADVVFSRIGMSIR